MTVKELIEELQLKDPCADAVLVIDVDGNSYHNIYGVRTEQDLIVGIYPECGEVLTLI